ncbi:uncharacterized protein LOC123318607 [Coccinella septempunctata]|uniref:uncharacterized protein LOC123318607 n=1 Tax=Coccinella septempunctata TaxID=41139 RepID=UPI001D06C8B1|nr:uncharacterized protein LOC123318607 [Coccinella septempunctata]
MMYERASISPFARRRLTRDWRILAEDVEDQRFSKCTTRRKTFVNEVWLESAVDLHNLVFNTLDFVTGSFYEGQCSKTGMEGMGTYTFPHGVVYEGQFRDGMFHGKGILIYPNGQAMNCTFQKGKMTKWEFLFMPPNTNLTDDDYSISAKRSWAPDSDVSFKVKAEGDLDIATYCQPPDRRFHLSHTEGLKPATKENLTNIRPTREIPEDCYDVGDGFYNPRTKWVHHAGDMDNLLYMAPENSRTPKLSTERARREFTEKIPNVPIYKNEKWIKDHCRKAWDENVGYKPSLYEYWFSGRNERREKMNMRYHSEGGNFVKEESINEECLKYFQPKLAFAEKSRQSSYSPDQ